MAAGLVATRTGKSLTGAARAVADDRAQYAYDCNVLSRMPCASANSRCVCPIASNASAMRAHSGYSTCFAMPGSVNCALRPGDPLRYVFGRAITPQARFEYRKGSLGREASVVS